MIQEIINKINFWGDMSVFYKHTVEDRLEVGKKLGAMIAMKLLPLTFYFKE